MTGKDIDIDALWRSQRPAVNTADILRHIDAGKRAQRLLDASYAAVIVLSLTLTGYLELAGAFRFPWILFGLVAVSAAGYVFRRIADARRLPETASLPPRPMLEFALRQAKLTFRVARALYTVLPAGVIAGYLAGPLLTDSSSEFGRPFWLKLLMVGSAALVLGIVVVAGWRIARAASRRIEVLRDRLDQFDQDL